MKLPYGTEHEFIGKIQDQLREAGFDPGETNAVYDAQTRKAVSDYQAANNLQATGTVDEATIDKLDIDKDEAEDFPEPEPEREHFRHLLASNPNYFGTAPELDYEVVEDFANQTFYEELQCVGYEPTAERLEAIVHVKRTYGYGGDICTAGTPEYVRFYIDRDNNGNWDDLGMAQFTVYDIPGDKPLEYGVSLTIDPDEEFCFEENLPTIRAILSWNQPPPPNAPNHTPVWGNVHESRIQIDPIRLLPFGDLTDQFDLAAPDPILEGIDPTQTLSLETESLDLAALAETYEGTSVQPKRYGYSHITKSLDSPEFTSDLDQQTVFQPLVDLDIDFDPEDVIADLLDEQANTYYEELSCVGLTHDGLNASLSVKRPNGYSGGLCADGSEEYVAFWEWDASAGQWRHLGTSSVNVHDIQNVPGDGLQYAVHLPAPLTHHRQPCADGPSTVRIRATLSWETPPPSGDPYWTPTWGNSMETRVHVPPGPTVEGTGGYLETVGKLKPCKIDKGTGYATGTSTLEGFHAEESPFGGTVEVTGFVADPPDILDGEAPMKYRVMVRPYGTTPSGGTHAWQPVRDTFDITVSEKVGSGPYEQYDIEQTPDEDGFYTYREDFPHGGDWRFVAERTLVKWNTGGKEGKWELKLEFKEPGEDPVIAEAPTCADGSSRGTVVLYLDNTGPEASIDITAVEPTGGAKQPADDCGKITVGPGDERSFPTVGDTIHGTYEATDDHFNWAVLDVRPGAEAHGATIDPTRRAYDTVSTTGESSTWELNTDDMESCGYIARIRVRDRTIVNSDHIGWRASDAAGFCLEEATETDGGTTPVAQESELMEMSKPTAVTPVDLVDHQFDSPGNDHENLNEEYITLTNTSETDLDLTGWRIEDEVGHTYGFPAGFTLESDTEVTLRTGTGEDSDSELYWGETQAVWNNTGDTVFIYNGEDKLVLTESY